MGIELLVALTESDFPSRGLTLVTLPSNWERLTAERLGEGQASRVSDWLHKALSAPGVEGVPAIGFIMASFGLETEGERPFIVLAASTSQTVEATVIEVVADIVGAEAKVRAIGKVEFCRTFWSAFRSPSSLSHGGHGSSPELSRLLLGFHVLDRLAFSNVTVSSDVQNRRMTANINRQEKAK
ncbi:MAG: hypothetical protein JWQ89_2276 [Devosia sp.]|uniref:hypothetical protein n=1 Tax=Devosia sp. TaxID=1871048 RepID=UPI0026179671|nr:hypothetical protein [Devosia sp.]MDB5540549.1 hypothetical protein [Devosia sp.]